MSEKYEFLSDEWVAAAKKIREEAGGGGGAGHQMKMNFVITGAPFKGEGEEIHAHLDGASGSMDMGHLDDPEVSVTVDYDTAKDVFVNGNQQAGMQAFMAGKIKVTGDITKLMAMQNAPQDPAAAELTAKIKEITA